MQNQEFAGASKINTSFLTPLERRLAPVVIPKIPAWLETHHLTMLTLIWSLLILLFSYLAATNIRWLWLVSVMIFLQYVTDHVYQTQKKIWELDMQHKATAEVEA